MTNDLADLIQDTIIGVSILVGTICMGLVAAVYDIKQTRTKGIIGS